MKNILKNKKKLVISITICIMFIAVSFSSVTADPPGDKPTKDNPSNDNVPGDDDWIRNETEEYLYTFYEDDYVGIGTSTPSTKLDVNGVITATDGDSNDWNAAYSWGDHSTFGYDTTNDSWKKVIGYDDNTYTMGYVGIGTISPGYPLQILSDNYYSSVFASNTLGSGIIGSTSGENGIGVIGTSESPSGIGVYASNANLGGTALYSFSYDGLAGDFHGNVNISGDVNIIGDIGIATDSPDYKVDIVGDRIRLNESNDPGSKTIELRTDGTYVDVNANNADLFLHSWTGSTILQAFGGSVGIGTWMSTPEADLHINETGGNGNADLMLESYSGTKWNFGGSEDYLFFASRYDDKWHDYMFIENETGYIGMNNGTFFDPQYQLDVVGEEIRLRNTTEPDAKEIRLRTDGLHVDLNAYNADLFLHSWSGNTILQAFSGNVGIGTMFPLGDLYTDSKTLEIEGVAPSILLDDTDGVNTDDFEISNGGDKILFRDATDDIDILSIGLTGEIEHNVGIGTNNPTEKLEVDGTVKIDGGISMPIKTISTDYTVLDEDYTIIADAHQPDDYTVTLPPAAELPGRIIVIRRIGPAYSSSNPDYCNITMRADVGEYIDTIANGVLIGQNMVYTLQSDGINNWYVISKSYGYYEY